VAGKDSVRDTDNATRARAARTARAKPAVRPTTPVQRQLRRGAHAGRRRGACGTTLYALLGTESACALALGGPASSKAQ